MPRLREEVTCLHCWARFAPEDLLWRSEHRELMGDPLLGDVEQLRFLPNRFDLSGNAIDMKGLVCREIACPTCHLILPRAILTRKPTFVSILGLPSCGKSWYLAALTNCLRREFPKQFLLSFTDADPDGNRILAEYEERVFLSDKPREAVLLNSLIRKTEEHGELYHKIRRGQLDIELPRPFSFLLDPLPTHPNFAKGESLHRLLCLYDNAGEHFLAGHDSTSNPGTRHLAESSFLLFLFDPTRDPRWTVGLDPAQGHHTRDSRRQELLLREAASRLTKLLARAEGVKHDRPVFIVLNKMDEWQDALSENARKPPVISAPKGMSGLDLQRIANTSLELRALLLQQTPELVYTAEAHFERVTYLACSSLGQRPKYADDGRPFMRPKDIRPWGVTVPLLLGMRCAIRGMIPATDTAAAI